jgi:hypothetical protein
MTIHDNILGECELEIDHDSFSCVDSFISSGYSITLDRKLTDAELDQLQTKYEDVIQSNSGENGYSRNHN